MLEIGVARDGKDGLFIVCCADQAHKRDGAGAHLAADPGADGDADGLSAQATRPAPGGDKLPASSRPYRSLHLPVIGATGGMMVIVAAIRRKRPAQPLFEPRGQQQGAGWIGRDSTLFGASWHGEWRGDVFDFNAVNA